MMGKHNISSLSIRYDKHHGKVLFSEIGKLQGKTIMY